jgi:hypothetical protein
MSLLTLFGSSSGGGGSSTPFPAGADALYSLRLIGPGYSGFCVEVLRASDNSTMNIGFVDGVIDIATALAFAGGSNLQIFTWYDQSGNANNATQSTSLTSQPILVVINGQPWISFGNSGGSSVQFLTTVSPITLTGDQTINLVAQISADTGMVPLGCIDGTHGWFVSLNPSPHVGAIGFFTDVNGTLFDTSNVLTSNPNPAISRITYTRASGVFTTFLNNVQTETATGITNGASTAAAVIGQVDGAQMEGLIGEIAIYGSALNSTNRQAIDASQKSFFADTGFTIPFNGTAAVQFGSGETLQLGDVLDIERTVPWTAFVAAQVYSSASENGDLTFFSNINHSDANKTGYGAWYLTDGSLIVRISNDLGTNAIDVRSAPGVNVVVDGKKHIFAFSYDGSSTAAGVAAYIDGVPATLTAFENNLTASIIDSGQVFCVGSQINDPNDHIDGTIGFFQLDTVVRNSAYVAAHTTAATLPPLDPTNTAVRLNFTEGSGATVHDATTNALNGTLSSPTMWVSGGPVPIPTTLATTEAPDTAAIHVTDNPVTPPPPALPIAPAPSFVPPTTGIGSPADLLQRVIRVLPRRWWQFMAPIRDAVIGGLASQAAFSYLQIQYAIQQARIKSSTGPFLDIISQDFFGGNLPRALGQNDASFLQQILANLFAPKQTRAAIVEAVENLTGFSATVVEPWNPLDWGGYGIPVNGYGIGLGYGSLSFNNQVFVTVKNFGGGIPLITGYGHSQAGYGACGSISEYADISEVTGAVTDAEVFQTVANTIAEGVTAWVDIE